MAETGFWDYKIGEALKTQPDTGRCPVLLADKVLGNIGIKNLSGADREPLVDQCRTVISTLERIEGEE